MLDNFFGANNMPVPESASGVPVPVIPETVTLVFQYPPLSFKLFTWVRPVLSPHCWAASAVIGLTTVVIAKMDAKSMLAFFNWFHVLPSIQGMLGTKKETP